MTVLCLLVRGPSAPRCTKALSSIVYQKRKVDKVEPSANVVKKQRDSEKMVERITPELKPVVNKTYVPFFEMLLTRREEARRSILMETEGLQDAGSIKQFCAKLGSVKHCFLYRRPGKNFVLVEFHTSESKKRAMESSYDSKDPLSIPVFSPVVYYQSASQNNKKPRIPDNTADTQCNEETALKELPDLQCANNNRLKIEMAHLHKRLKITDLSIRLRYFTCHQLDQALQGLFRDVKALPFGSTVSGFGRNSGDLDVYLHFKKNLNLGNERDTSNLFFHSKSWVRDKNVQLKLISDIISVLLPGCSDVKSILGARVPIIKYHQMMTNVECDIQNSSASGIDSSHILYLMNEWDTRVAPLVYTVRIWAAQNIVTTTKKPAPFITNFSLVFMVIFFLQSEQILPSLQSFNSLPSDINALSFDPNANLVFPDLRKVEKGLLSSGDNDQSIDSLLIKFFKFYSNFNFDKQKLSIYYGKAMPKAVRSALDIENPTNPSMNIAKNVRVEYLQVFLIAAKEAYTILSKGDPQSRSLRSIMPLTSSGGGKGTK